MEDVSPRTQEIAKPFLWRNERILWGGSPNALRVFGMMRLPIAFGVLLMAFGVIELFGVSLAGSSGEIFRRIGHVWAYIGIGTGAAMILMFGLGSALETRNTLFVITDKRFLWINGLTKKLKLALAPGDASGLKLVGQERIEIEMARVEDTHRPSIQLEYVAAPARVAELLSDTLNLNLRMATEEKRKPLITFGSVYAAILSTFYEMVPRQPAHPFSEIFRLLLTWCGYLSVLAFVTLMLPPAPWRHAFSFAAFFIITHGLLERWSQIRRHSDSDNK